MGSRAGRRLLFGRVRPRTVGIVALAVLAVAALVVTVVVRRGGPGSHGPTPAEALAAVDGFDPARPETIVSLNKAAGRGGDLGPALATRFTDPSRPRRWAAVYLAALAAHSPADADALAPLLRSDDKALRAMAAGALARLGKVEAVAVLVEAAQDQATFIPYFDPPRPAAEIASDALGAYTGQPPTDGPGWQRWYDSVKGRLRWDGGRFVAK